MIIDITSTKNMCIFIDKPIIDYIKMIDIGALVIADVPSPLVP